MGSKHKDALSLNGCWNFVSFIHDALENGPTEAHGLEATRFFVAGPLLLLALLFHIVVVLKHSDGIQVFVFFFLPSGREL